MAGQGNGNRGANGRRGPIKGRAILRDAFVQSLHYAGATKSAASRWLGKRPSTIRRWIAGTHRVDVEVIIESPKLGRHFADCVALLRARAARQARRER